LSTRTKSRPSWGLMSSNAHSKTNSSNSLVAHCSANTVGRRCVYCAWSLTILLRALSPIWPRSFAWYTCEVTSATNNILISYIINVNTVCRIYRHGVVYNEHNLWQLVVVNRSTNVIFLQLCNSRCRWLPAALSWWGVTIVNTTLHNSIHKNRHLLAWHLLSYRRYHCYHQHDIRGIHDIAKAIILVWSSRFTRLKVICVSVSRIFKDTKDIIGWYGHQLQKEGLLRG